MLVSSFTKALHDLLLPEILKIFLICLLVYILGWIVIAWIISGIITGYVGVTGAEGFFMHALGSMGGIVIAWFLFPLLYPILIGFFDDKIAETIEKTDYPALTPAQPPFWPTLASDALFSLKAVGLNILFLPLYLVPVINIVIYYWLNGTLLGTQFFRMAAGRRVTQAEAEKLQKKAANSILLIGVAISFFATIPLLNLAAPVLGVATMLHLFHEVRGTGKQQILPPEEH
jgi:uncharacterized protein involved in cysteine biosynthesis